MTYPSTPDWSAYDPFLVSIGEIGVTRHWVVTPNGQSPVCQVHFTFTNLSRTTTTIPTWAIVMAILFFFLCFLGLLFLLVKEERTEGWVQVGATSPGLAYSVQIPVSSPQQVMHYAAQIEHARAIAAAAA